MKAEANQKAEKKNEALPPIEEKINPKMEKMENTDPEELARALLSLMRKERQ